MPKISLDKDSPRLFEGLGILLQLITVKCPTRDQAHNSHPTPKDSEYHLRRPPMMNTAVTTMLEDRGVPSQGTVLDNLGG